MAGMGPENLEEFGLAMKGAEALTPFLETAGEQLGTIAPAEVVEAFGGLVPEVDKLVLTGGRRLLRVGLPQGVRTRPGAPAAPRDSCES